MKKQNTIIAVFTTFFILMSFVGCNVNENTQVESMPENQDVDISVSKGTTQNQQAENEEQPMVNEIQPTGTVITETLVNNLDGEYSITVPETWINKTSYEYSGNHLTIFHMTKSDTSIETNPILLELDEVQDNSDSALDYMATLAGDRVSYIASLPRFDFPYKSDSDDGIEYAQFSQEIPSVLETFWINEELVEGFSDDFIDDFSVAGIDDYKMVYDFLDSLSNTVSAHMGSDFSAKYLEEYISFPINLEVDGTRTTFNNIEELEKVQEKVFTDDVLLAMQNPTDLFVNDLGVSISAGRVWINLCEDGKIRITAINQNV